MNLLPLELPEESKDWPDWLERQLVGLQLRDLVQQWETISPPDHEPTPSLESVLGNQEERLLDEGLKILDDATLRQLVRHPRLLYPLQELILLEGGEYWRSVVRTDEHRRTVEFQWGHLSPTLLDTSLDAQSHSPSIDDLPKGDEVLKGVLQKGIDEKVTQAKLAEKGPTKTRYWKESILVLSGLAATLLAAFFLWPTDRSQPLFFARTEILQSKLQGAEFLRSMAVSIQKDWKPNLDRSEELRKQLLSFRDSCDALLAAKLSQLEPSIAEDLKKRCQNWRNKIDGNLADLAAGKSISEVRSEASATIERLSKALEELAVSSQG